MLRFGRHGNMEGIPLLRSAYASGVRIGAASFAVAEILLVLYPAIRPFLDET